MDFVHNIILQQHRKKIFLSFERSKLDGKYSLIVSVCMHALLQRNIVLDIVYYLETGSLCLCMHGWFGLVLLGI